MKKFNLFALTIITSAFTLVACGNNVTPESTPATTTETEDTTITEANTSKETDEASEASKESDDTNDSDVALDEESESETEFGTDVWGITIDPTYFFGYTTKEDSVVVNYIGEDAAGTSLFEIKETDYATDKEAITAATDGRKITDFETVSVNGYDMTYAAIVRESTEGVQIEEAYYAITWKGKTILINKFITLDENGEYSSKIDEALNGFYLTVQPATE